MTTNKNNLAIPETTEITFRKKFEKLLTDDNRAIITGAVKRFCDFNPSSAILHLWHLTSGYKADSTFERLGLSKETVGDVTLFRNELRYQYELRHPVFLDVDIPDCCRAAFDALKNKADGIVALIVYQHCLVHVNLDNNEIERTLHLLGSNKAEFNFGGIRNLSSDIQHEEATYLMRFYTQIHDLLKALYEDKLEREASSKNRPLAKLGSLLGEGPDLPFFFGSSDGNEAASNPASGAEHDTSTGVKHGIGFDVEGPEIVFKPAPEAPHDDTSAQDLSGQKEAERPEQPCENDDTKVALNLSSGFEVLSATQILKHQSELTKLLSSELMSTLLLLRGSGFNLNEIVDKEDKISGFLQASNNLFG